MIRKSHDLHSLNTGGNGIKVHPRAKEPDGLCCQRMLQPVFNRKLCRLREKPTTLGVYMFGDQSTLSPADHSTCMQSSDDMNRSATRPALEGESAFTARGAKTFRGNLIQNHRVIQLTWKR